jgi:hypothetical protein
MISIEDMTVPRSLALLAMWFYIAAPCLGEDPSRSFYWDGSKIEKDWESISQSKFLSATERAALISAVAAQIRSSMSDLNIKSDQQLREFAARTWIKVVDLGDNRHQEVLAQAADPSGFLCSPTGNCEVWIFRQLGDKYSVILNRGAVQNFTIQPTITNGFHDIVLGQHGSATEQGLKLFRFDGSAYRLAACYEARWEILEHGEAHGLDQPQITPCQKRNK